MIAFPRWVPLVILGFLPAARAQAPCGGSTISADIAVVSVTAGGVQHLGLDVAPIDVGPNWRLIGTLSGTSPGSPYFALGGLLVNEDRYTRAMFTGHSQFVTGGVAANFGVAPVFDAQGHADLAVVIPPVVYSSLIGRTMHHGFFRIDVSLLPECGSNTVALTFVP